MAYTSPELVRRHIDTIRTGNLPVSDVRVTLNGTQSASLPHRSLVDTSIVVKARRSPSLTQESVVLADEWVSLANSRLVEETVLVSRDTSLTGVYTHNVDVVIDAASGRLRRISGGAIAQGQQVIVFYDYYHVYAPDDDYTVNADSGTMARQSTGEIADGQAVMVDYEVSVNVVPDAMIEQGIDEAADTVLAIIDQRYHDQLLPGLVIGETHLAVAAVCRMQALEVLGEAETVPTSVRDQARLWTELAQSYDQSGRERLRRYAAPIPALSAARKG